MNRINGWDQATTKRLYLLGGTRGTLQTIERMIGREIAKEGIGFPEMVRLAILLREVISTEGMFGAEIEIQKAEANGEDL